VIFLEVTRSLSFLIPRKSLPRNPDKGKNQVTLLGITKCVTVCQGLAKLRIVGYWSSLDTSINSQEPPP
jgi:hypothetical protein